MKAKTKFTKMFYKLPIAARGALVVRFATTPMTLDVVALEVRHNTPLGKELLNELGFQDE